ncbi:MAG: MATE family efflux transporter [Lachnospiraceae bacterium]|nr:MATE family efflux transporter [Lachnospiraceae bacterium]
MSKTFDYKGKLVDDPVDHELGRLPIGQLLFKMSVPMVISMFMLALYNVVDSIFISRVSEDALSALSLAYPVQFLMVALNIGTNIGMVALISRSLGEKNFNRANDFASHGLFLAIIYSIIFAILGFLFTEPFFNAMTSDENIRQEGINYLTIITIISFGFFIQTTFEKMMQATGKTVGSMITQLTGAITNIILDPIFIFGYYGIPAMGTSGAAIATVIGQILGMFVGFILNKIINKDLSFRFIFLKVRDKNDPIFGSYWKFNLAGINLDIIKNIYRVGLPSIIMQSIGSFMVMGLNAILIKYQSAVAVLGVYYKLQSFIFMPVIGLNNGMVPIVSYNFGAHRKDRINRVIKSALIAGFNMMVAGAIILFAFTDKILYLFNANDTMMDTGIYAFRVIALHFPLVSFNIILGSVMQATKKEIYTLIISLIRQIIILLPTAYILSNFFGLKGVWFCFILSEAIAFIITLMLFKKTYVEQIDTL